MYDNITEFAYPVDRLWIPDVRIYDALNGPDVGGISGHQHGLTMIGHDGKVKFIPQLIVKGPIDFAAGKDTFLKLPKCLLCFTIDIQKFLKLKNKV